MNLDKLDDKELILYAKKQNQEVYKILYKRHNKKIYNFLRKYPLNNEEKQDIIQDSYFKLFSKSSYYNASDSKFTTWFYTIIKNTAIDYLREKKHKGRNLVNKTLDASYFSDFIRSQTFDSPEETLHKKELYNLIDNLIKKLPSKQRQIIQLVFRENPAYKELSKRLDCPISTIKARIHKGKQSLKKQLIQEFGMEINQR